ncbi:MAG: excisionase [Hydrogenophilales bacterium CG_4_9_14_3_um_filter_63_34]|nr:MAG: excisionase [Hydrogenophilales bacterium CG_4_10_14_3_um_filter_63_21]PJB03907.1 MAG: excisionase [Hydrogenophilales bacterium CG_4_9_14_3_um_filter_63_34]
MDPISLESKRLYCSTSQAAKMLGVSLGTAQNMVEEGVLDAWKTSGGHRRIKRESVMAMLARRGGAQGTPVNNEGGLSVLIAEDDADLQKLYRKTMEGWELPLSIEIVSNGFDALLVVGRRAPDVFIVDLAMAGMDGFELVRALHGNPALATTNIIVVSSLSRADIAKRGILPPDVPIYGKPIPFHELHGFFRARNSQKLRLQRDT